MYNHLLYFVCKMHYRKLGRLSSKKSEFFYRFGKGGNTLPPLFDGNLNQRVAGREQVSG